MTYPLKPIEQPYSPEVEGILAQYPSRDGQILNVFRVFANSVRFLRKGMPNLLDKASPLPMRERELVILRVCANNGCEYEWGVHVTAFSQHVGLSQVQVDATVRAGVETSNWSAEECLLLTVVDELCESGAMSPATLSEFRDRWNQEQQLEIFALCGAYHTVSFVANNSELSPESYGALFPSRE
jgi:alkylhydroperoxidase family enzyme